MTTTPPEPQDGRPADGPDQTGAEQTAAYPQQPAQAEQTGAEQTAVYPQQPAPGAAAPVYQQQQPAYAAAPGYAAAPPPPAQGGPGAPYQPYQPAPAGSTTNVLAIVAFVGSFFVSLVGIICGHIALSQIKRTGEKGRGFALAGTIIGYVSFAGTILAVTLIIITTIVSGLAVANAVRSLPTSVPVPTDSADDAALAVDCARLSAAADTLVPIIEEQVPNLTTDPAAAQVQIVAALDAFTAATSGLNDPDLAAEIDTFNADVDLFKSDLADYVATPEADRDPSLLQDDVSMISDDFSALGDYCG